MCRQLRLLTTQILSHGLGRPEEVVIGTFPKVPRVGFEPTTFGFEIQEILCTADLTARPRVHYYSRALIIRWTCSSDLIIRRT